ncbi:WXG100-like domain-containing protein [Streptomyces lydicus]|uniref:WXG100-like domain-containing protein n=1 Tax=Streptomyces lydicus TaxID=47763 RepID=UPI0036EE4E1B
MSTYTLPDASGALSAIGLPYPGGDPQHLQTQAETHAALAADLAMHAERLSNLIQKSQRAWQGEAAEAFRNAVIEQAARVELAAKTAAQLSQGHAEHAQKMHRALEIIKELAIQIAATLAFMAAAAWFPPLLAAAEAQLATLAASAGRFIQWLSDLLSTIVRFLVQARTWISQVSSLTWRTESFSLGYGKMLFDGVRDATVDILANLTTRGITHKPLDISMVWSALGSGLSGGVFGALESSGVRKAVNAAGEVKRSADGLPEFVSFGDQAKNWVNSLGKGKTGTTAVESAEKAADRAPVSPSAMPRREATSAPTASSLDAATARVGKPAEETTWAKTAVANETSLKSAAPVGERSEAAAVSSVADAPSSQALRPDRGTRVAAGSNERAVPSRTEIEQALGGQTPHSPAQTPTAAGHGEMLARLRAARAEVRGLGLRGLSGERGSLAREVAETHTAHQAAVGAQRSAQKSLNQARTKLATAEGDIGVHSRALTDLGGHESAIGSGRRVRTAAPTNMADSLRPLSHVEPSNGTSPIGSTESISQRDSIRSVTHTQPTNPINPTETISQTEPMVSPHPADPTSPLHSSGDLGPRQSSGDQSPATPAAGQEPLHRYHLQALETARHTRTAAAQEVEVAHHTVQETAKAADATGRTLDTVLERQRAWEVFAKAGQQVRENVPVHTRLVEAWQHNTWKDGLATEYGSAAGGQATAKPSAWAKENVVGFGDLALKAIGSPKSWRQAAFYETTKGFLKSSMSNAISTGLAFEPGKTDPRVWLAVPLAGAGGALRSGIRGAVHNRLVPDKSIEDAVFNLGMSSLTKNVQKRVLDEVTT